MLATWVRFAFSQGFVCIRSHTSGCGHQAFDSHVKNPYRPSLEECLSWAESGGNVEVLLHESGLLQVDAERNAPQPWCDPGAHATIISESAGLGLHAIYLAPEGLRQARHIKPIPGVDLMARGVWPLPGCRRDGDGEKPAGQWRALCEPCPAAPAPDWVLAALPADPPRRKRIAPAATSSGLTRRASAALRGELAAVRGAPDGSRHSQLIRSAAKLGQLVGMGELDEGEVRAELEQAAHETQPDQLEEAMRAIDDGLAWGKEHPREDAPRIEQCY